MWYYDSLDQRDRCREAMRSDSEFKAYWRDGQHLIIEQSSRILKPAPFFAEQLGRMAELCKAPA